MIVVGARQSEDVCFAQLGLWQHSLAFATTLDENDEGLTLSPSFRLSPTRQSAGLLPFLPEHCHPRAYSRF